MLSLSSHSFISGTVIAAKLEFQRKTLIIKEKEFAIPGPNPWHLPHDATEFFLPHSSPLFYVPFSLESSLLPIPLERANVPDPLIFCLVMRCALSNAIHVQARAFNVIVGFSPGLTFLPLPWEQVVSIAAAPSAWVPEWEDARQTCSSPTAGSRAAVIAALM